MSTPTEAEPAFDVLSHQISDHSHQFELALPADKVDALLNARLAALAPRASLPGFRPGKAPRTALARRHGRTLRADVLQALALRCANALCQTHGLQPIARPQVREITSATEDRVRVLLQVETLPTLQLVELPTLQLERPVVADSEQDPELQALSDLVLRTRLFDALDEQHRFPVALTAIKAEARRLQAGYRAEVGESPDQATRRLLERIARRRLRLGVLLTEFGRRLQIQVGQDELRALISEQAGRDPALGQALEDYYLSQPAALAQLRAPLFEQRVVSALLEQCQVTTVPVPEATLRALAQPEQPDP